MIRLRSPLLFLLVVSFLSACATAPGPSLTAEPLPNNSPEADRTAVSSPTQDGPSPLSRYLLQPSEAPAGFNQSFEAYENAGVDESLFSTPAREHLVALGAENSISRWYTLEGAAGAGIFVSVIGFRDIAGAEKGFREEMCEPGVPNLVTVQGLGDEGCSTSAPHPRSPDQIVTDHWWRSGRLLLFLRVVAKPSTLTEADARPLADKMQSHVK